MKKKRKKGKTKQQQQKGKKKTNQELGPRIATWSSSFWIRLKDLINLVTDTISYQLINFLEISQQGLWKTQNNLKI